MHVSQVLEPPLRVDDREVDVQVAIRLLGFFNQIDDMIHRFQISGRLRGIPGVRRREEVADSLNPV